MTIFGSITQSFNRRNMRALLAASAVAAATIAAAPVANAANFSSPAPVAENLLIEVHGRRHGGHNRGNRGGYGNHGGGQYGMLSRQDIRYNLRNRGFRRISGISLYRGAYIAQAWKRGRLMNLRINARNGSIIDRSPVWTPQRRHGGGHQYRNRHNGGRYSSHGRARFGIYFGY